MSCCDNQRQRHPKRVSKDGYNPIIVGDDVRQEIESEESYPVTQSDLPATKRCKNCQQYYTPTDTPVGTDEPICIFHHGIYKSHYNSNFVGAVKLLSWSCCGNVDQSNKGCMRNFCHTEDITTTRALNKYDYLAQNAQQTTEGSKQETSNGSKFPGFKVTPLAIDPKLLSNDNLIKREITPPEEVIKREEIIAKNLAKYMKQDCKVHELQYSETLPQIALKYNVSVEDIKEANGLKSNDVQGRGILELYIPKNGNVIGAKEAAAFAKIKKQLIRKFCTEFKVLEDEANYYLNDTNYDYESARDQYNNDLKCSNEMIPIT